MFIVRPSKRKINTKPVNTKSKTKHRRIDDTLRSNNAVPRKITYSEINRVGKYCINIVSISYYK